MEVRPDSAISDQDVHHEAARGGQDSGADGQEAGRINGMMKTLGKRTSERDEAYAERDRLREQLAAMTAVEPASDPAEPPQLPESTPEPTEALTGSEPPQEPPPEYELPVGTVVTTPDGSQYLIRAGRAGNIAPTSPSRSTPHPSSELEAARQRFAAELPSAVAEMQDRALLRGR